MPLRDDILAPIAGANPSGENLKYAAVYDKIKEARREDDDAPQGEWKRDRKTADWAAVIKLSSEAIATKSKDVQLSAWLTEALLHKEGFPGLLAGLKLIQGLIENFWDTLYPEIEDDDTELRAAPIEWIGLRLEIPIRQAPVTKTGYGFLKYKEARAVGYEADAAGDEEKTEARNTAIAEGKLTAEEWDKAIQASSKDYYKQLVADFDAILETIEALSGIGESKFGAYAPSLTRLRESIEEVRHFASGLLQQKLALEPDEEAGEPAEGWDEASPETAEETVESTGPVKAAARRPAVSSEPVDRGDAFARVIGVAAWMRREDPYSPAPYLILRALRWGELRAAGTSLDPSQFDPPDTRIRQQLKKLAMDGSWEELLHAAETAMGQPCGRAWLDIQRHVVRACEELGGYYDPIASAVKSELRALLADYPDLPGCTMMDDTPVANAETQAWLEELKPAANATVETAPVMEAGEYAAEPSEERGPDSFDLAMAAARSGRAQEGIEILTAEIGRQHSGRGRFQRKMQLAQLCMSIGHEPIARSILEELARTVERHQLEEWESPDVIAHALGMLYACLQKLEGDPVEMQKLYARICRLDPMQALAQAR